MCSMVCEEWLLCAHDNSMLQTLTVKVHFCLTGLTYIVCYALKVLLNTGTRHANFPGVKFFTLTPHGCKLVIRLCDTNYL